MRESCERASRDSRFSPLLVSLLLGLANLVDREGPPSAWVSVLLLLCEQTPQ